MHVTCPTHLTIPNLITLLIFGVYSVLVGRPERNRPLIRPRRRGEENIKIDLTR